MSANPRGSNNHAKWLLGDMPAFPGAPCSTHPLGLDPWFPANGGKQLTVIARRVCGTCPHQEPCGVWAVDHPAEQGMWGGLTQEQRADIRRCARQPLRSVA